MYKYSRRQRALFETTRFLKNPVQSIHRMDLLSITELIAESRFANSSVLTSSSESSLTNAAEASVTSGLPPDPFPALGLGSLCPPMRGFTGSWLDPSADLDRTDNLEDCFAACTFAPSPGALTSAHTIVRLWTLASCTLPDSTCDEDPVSGGRAIDLDAVEDLFLGCTLFSRRVRFRIIEFQWFLTALSVLPGKYLAISTHLLPSSLCLSWRVSSSSTVHDSRRIPGFN
mmetsp:Transcript_11221/g.46864  ORF Transcript_11221/g.46864 Transcript_11221/m.46864 type:complete len:229 (-) Transcript_11221:626-1312(-)